MPSWDPNQYLKFTDHRLRPALDLLAQIPAADPRSIYDLGCGPGNITRLLAERWPDARVTGIDSSADMLAKARQEAPRSSKPTSRIGRRPRRPISCSPTPPCIGWTITPRCCRASPRSWRRAACSRSRCRTTARRPRTC